MKTKLVVKSEEGANGCAAVGPMTLGPTTGEPLVHAPAPQTVLVSGPTLEEMTSAQKVALGMASVASGLAEAAKKAALSVGFGTLGLGGVLLIGEHFGKTGSTAVGLLAIGAFFVCAAIGKILDRRWGLP